MARVYQERTVRIRDLVTRERDQTLRTAMLKLADEYDKRCKSLMDPGGQEPRSIQTEEPQKFGVTRSASPDPGTVLYEIRLLGPSCRAPIILGTVAATDHQAVEYARRALKRHPERDRAEIWHGMKLVRQV